MLNLSWYLIFCYKNFSELINFWLCLVFTAACGLLAVVASLVAEHRLKVHRLQRLELMGLVVVEPHFLQEGGPLTGPQTGLLSNTQK